MRAQAGQRMIEACFGRMLAPTTAIGCAALLRHIEAHEASYDRCLFDDCADSVCSNGHQLLSHIAAMLEAKPVRDGGRVIGRIMLRVSIRHQFTVAATQRHASKRFRILKRSG